MFLVFGSDMAFFGYMHFRLRQLHRRVSLKQLVCWFVAVFASCCHYSGNCLFRVLAKEVRHEAIGSCYNSIWNLLYRLWCGFCLESNLPSFLAFDGFLGGDLAIHRRSNIAKSLSLEPESIKEIEVRRQREFVMIKVFWKRFAAKWFIAKRVQETIRNMISFLSLLLFFINRIVFTFSIIVTIWLALYVRIYCFVNTGAPLETRAGWKNGCFFSKAFLFCRYIMHWGSTIGKSKTYS